MAGSSLAAPDAAGWVTDFLNAAYYARPAAARDVADLRLAYGIVTTRWDRLGRRLRAHDAIAFHRAFGADRFLRAPRLTAHARAAARGRRAAARRRVRGRVARSGAARLGRRVRRRRRRARRTSPSAGCATRRSARSRRPRAPEDRRHWSTYPPVPLPSAEAAIAVLSDPSRWPDFGCALGRFTALRSGGLEGQTFEIEVVAHPAPRTPVFTPRLRHRDRPARRAGRDRRRARRARGSTRPRCRPARRRGCCSSSPRTRATSSAPPSPGS